VTQEQRGDDECVTCYDLQTGELIWIHAAERRHSDLAGLGKVGPRATPTIRDGRVYAVGATGVLECLDGNRGSLLWSVDVPKLLGIEMVNRTNISGWKYQYESSRLSWGRSASPLVYGDLVIVPGGGPEDGPFHTLVAFDKLTGEERWRGGNRMIAYGSPKLEKLLGREQITLVAESSAMGFDPSDGTVLWESDRPGFSNADANCTQAVRLADDLVLLSKGYQLGGETIRLAETEAGIAVETVWKNPRVLKTKMMTPIARDGYAYCLSDGFLECSQVDDPQLEGRRMWRQRGRFGNGQMLLVGDYLLVHSEDGVLRLVEASPNAYRELCSFPTIDGVCWNTICLYKNYLLVRSELEMACIELPYLEVNDHVR
jgi:outer membrane protein assembly factor BamB